MSLELRIPRRLESPNTWNGRHWRVKHRISQDWAHEIGGAWFQKIADDARAKGKRAGVGDALEAMIGPKKAYGFEAARMRVEVERHVPSARNFIRDDDNLRFAVKPLLDALKRLGYIKNDSRKWLDHPTPTQHVSADGRDWTVVRIEAIQ
jgi:hypothetical protein